MSCKCCKAIRIRKSNCTQQLETLAPNHLKEKQILSLIVSLQNFLSSASVIHHRILNAMITYKIQRKCLLNLLLMDGSWRILKKNPNCKPCQYWIRSGRTNGCWLRFHRNRVAPSEWKENFRMSRESFLVLCTELNDDIVKSSTRFRKAVSVQEQVALTLYYLFQFVIFKPLSNIRRNIRIWRKDLVCKSSRVASNQVI